MPDNTGQLRGKWSAYLLDGALHLRIGTNGVGKQRYQLVPESPHLPALHIEIETGHEFTVAAARNQKRLTYLNGLRQRIVRMGRQDHVDAFDPGRELEVDLE